MSQVSASIFFGAPYFSQSQGAIDEHLVSKIESFDQAVAEEIFLKAAPQVQYRDPIILETENQRFEQSYIETFSMSYCNQEWIEQAGNGIDVFDKKTNEKVLELAIPPGITDAGRTVRQALVVDNKLFGLTKADRVLVWNLITGDFIENIALPHEHIVEIAHAGEKLILKTAKRYMTVI